MLVLQVIKQYEQLIGEITEAEGLDHPRDEELYTGELIEQFLSDIRQADDSHSLCTPALTEFLIDTKYLNWHVMAHLLQNVR